MATRKAPAKGNKRSVTKKQHTPDYYPCVRTLTLGVDSGSITGTMKGDVGRLLSISNRRLYRYGKNYQVKLDLVIPPDLGADFVVEVYALANNWDVQRAYALAKSVYDEARSDELKMAGGSSARWADFRVGAGVAGATVLTPFQYDNASLALTAQNVGEFVQSSVDKAGTRTYFTWGAAASNQIDIVNEWIESGRVSDDPSSFSSTAPYQGVNSDSSSDIELENINIDGNDPPYGPTGTSDQLVRVGTIFFRPGAIGLSKLSTGYFDAPCGLFVCKVTGNVGNGSLSMTAKSGDYKGVHATNMTQG